MSLALTSRMCRSCRGWFDTGMAPYEDGRPTRQSLDEHCGTRTEPVPTFDLDYPERRTAMRSYLAEHA